MKNVRLVYRRTKKQMPADEEELDLALADGVEFCELLAPKALNGAVLTCDVMELGEPDASGRRSPVATGETVELSATTVICAVGEGIDASLYDDAGVEHDRRGRLAATSTGIEGVWAAVTAAAVPLPWSRLSPTPPRSPVPLPAWTLTSTPTATSRPPRGHLLRAQGIAVPRQAQLHQDPLPGLWLGVRGLLRCVPQPRQRGN